MGTINVVFPKALNEQRAETKIWKMAIPPDQNILVRLLFIYGASSKIEQTLPFDISSLQLSSPVSLHTHTPPIISITYSNDRPVDSRQKSKIS